MLFFNRITIASIFMIIGFSLNAQKLSIGIGPNVSDLRDHVLLENNTSSIGFHSEFILRYKPFKSDSNLVLQNEVMFEIRGYDLEFGNNEFEFRFIYYKFPFLIGYKFFEPVRISTGFHIGLLSFVDNYRNIDEYNRFDAGLILDLTFFEGETFGFNFRFNYGLTPLLKYERVDDFGEILDEEGYFKFISGSIGLQINFPPKK